MLPEFDQEMISTRKTLERLPDDKFAWKPHDKSMPLGKLAEHLAGIPGWIPMTIDEDSLDLAPPGGSAPTPPPAETSAQLLELFDKNIAAARTALERVSDERLMQPWSLLHGGATLLTLPRVAVLRTFVMNHLIHHRAQLGVYLRLNDIPVPSVYGPSADEAGF
jgi:uncharacterized damage-inducible protein DinB